MRRAVWCAVVVLGLGAGCTRDVAVTGAEQARAQGVSTSPVRERPKRLRFAVTPFADDDTLRREYSPMAEYLSRTLGLPVDLEIAASYGGVVAQIVAGQVHLAVLSPLVYVEAKAASPSLVVLATPIAEGAPSYASYIVALASSGITDLEHLRGKRLAFVDPFSTSGYVYPMAMLREHGLEPETFLKSYVFAGNHTRVVELVLAGEVDAGATYATAVRSFTGDARAVQELQIVAKTGRIPYDAYCALGSLDADLIASLRAAFLGLSTRTDEGREVLAGKLSINGFVEVQDSHYDEVRRVMKLALGGGAAAGSGVP